MIRGRVPLSAGGYTGIELLVVLSLIITLASIALPGVLVSLRKGRLHSAANAILAVGAEARSRAMTEQGGATEHYGIVIAADAEGGYAALTHGPAPTLEHILRRGSDGEPVALRRFNPNVEVLVARGGPLEAVGDEIGWCYAARSGFPIDVDDPAAGAISVGLDDSPGLTGLELRTRDGRLSSRITIYRIGLGHATKVD